MRALYGLKLFVSAPDEVCFERRMLRDVQLRGREVSSVVEQYQKYVRPSAEQFVLPTMLYADEILRGDGPVEEAAQKTLVLIDRMQCKQSVS
jgi:uridine kinase